MNEKTLTRTGYRWELRAPGEPLARTEFELPHPGPGEALVRVAGCGVCHTDLGFLFDGVKTRAPLPLALGHEISGVVLEAGEGFEDLTGEAVIVPAVTPCGECESCRAGHGPICTRQVMPGNDIPGGFSTHVLVPARGLCRVPGGATAEGPIGRSGCTLAELSVVADAVTTPYQAIERARVGEDDLALVIGLGGVGGFAAQIAAAKGATVIGFDVDARRLALMADHGLARGFDVSVSDARTVKQSVREFVRERSLPATRWKLFECSGTAGGQELAWSLLGPGAYLSVVGYTLEKVTVRLSNLMAFDAKAAGNWGCVPELYPGALDLVLSGRVAVRPFVKCFPLDEAPEVLQRAHGRAIAARPILVP